MRVIRIRDVMFNHSRFFNPAELDISYISAVSIKNTIKVLDMPALFYAASRDIVEEDDPDDTIKVYSSPIGESMAEATPEEEEESSDEEQTAQQMATPDLTPDRENGYSTDGAGETRATRRPASYAEVSSDAVAMGTRSRRRQAYSTALACTTELTLYYSAFSAGLQKAEFDVQNNCLYRDTLPPKLRH
jgi:hypothetical protein